MPELPRGTVAFLFTDIEGSTQRWERSRAAMRNAVERHLALLTSAVDAHNGRLFKIVGDAVQAVFATAPEAIAAALRAQQLVLGEDWSEVGGLPVRMALHAGEAIPDDRGDYMAAPLNRLARLLSVGHGGQILLTQAVQQLCRDALPPGVTLQDLGEHRLRDLLEPERVFQLLHPTLPTVFPPLTTLDARPNNLPRQPTPLLGREQEVSDVVARLRGEDVQLVTLTGPGGTGKTRLAIHVGAELLDAFPDGVWFVDLAPLRDATLVLSTMASVLGMRDAGETPLTDRLVAALRDQRLLVILDNCEHVLAAAPEIASLLAACRHLTILSTSRAAWHLRAEQEVPVAPLPVPEHHPTASLEAVAQVPSVALFVQRATAANPRFTLTKDNVQAVAAICRQLDGLPLAIELAAARSKLLPPAALLQRLERRLPLLTGGPQDLPSRQQTLRNTIAWSHDLLSDEERILFRRLGVFVGGWTLEAAEVVTHPDGDLEVLEGLASLVDKSLVRQMELVADEPRFSMLETIREFALEQLEASGEAAGTRQRQAWHILALAQQANRELKGPEHGHWLARLATEYGNLRAALTWLWEHGHGETGLRLTAALADFIILRGNVSEARLWQERLLATGADLPPDVHATALYLAGEWATLAGDYLAGARLHEESLRLARHIGDPRLIAEVLYRFTDTANALEEPHRAVAMAEEALSLFRAVGDTQLVAAALVLLAQQARMGGKYARARNLFEKALALQQERPSAWGVPWTILGLAEVAAHEGDTMRAATLFAQSLRLHEDNDDHFGISWCLFGLGKMAAESARPQIAARLLGAAEVLRQASGTALQPTDRGPHDRYVTQLKADLGSAEFGTAWAEGRALPLERAISEAHALAAELAGTRPSALTSPHAEREEAV